MRQKRKQSVMTTIKHGKGWCQQASERVIKGTKIRQALSWRMSCDMRTPYTCADGILPQIQGKLIIMNVKSLKIRQNSSQKSKKYK